MTQIVNPEEVEIFKCIQCEFGTIFKNSVTKAGPLHSNQDSNGVKWNKKEQRTSGTDPMDSSVPERARRFDCLIYKRKRASYMQPVL